VDGDNVTLVDSTKKPYKLVQICAHPFAGVFPGQTIQANQSAFAAVVFNVDGTPATATYFDLTITITGSKFTFRQ